MGLSKYQMLWLGHYINPLPPTLPPPKKTPHTRIWNGNVSVCHSIDNEVSWSCFPSQYCDCAYIVQSLGTEFKRILFDTFILCGDRWGKHAGWAHILHRHKAERVKAVLTTTRCRKQSTGQDFTLKPCYFKQGWLGGGGGYLGLFIIFIHPSSQWRKVPCDIQHRSSQTVLVNMFTGLLIRW